MILKCQHCERSYKGRKGQKFCSIACMCRGRERGYRKFCKQCRQTFVARLKKYNFCSRACVRLSRRRRVQQPCDQCGHLFERRAYNTEARFCSLACSGLWRKLHPSPETRARQSAAAKRFNAKRRPVIRAGLVKRMKDPTDVLEAYLMGRRDKGVSSWESGRRIGHAEGYEQALKDVAATGQRSSWSDAAAIGEKDDAV